MDETDERDATTLTERPLGRRRLLLGAGVGGGGLALGLLGAAPASADDRHRSHPVLGAWLVKVMETGNPAITTAVAGFAAGGVFVSVDLAPPAPTSVGAWRATSRTGFRATFWQSALDDSGKSIGTVRIRISGRVHGDRASGTFTVKVFDLAGKVIATSSGTFTATRIEA